MKTIPLTRGEFALVDDCDYEHLMQWEWSCSECGYAVRGVRVKGKMQLIRMHRVVLERMGFKDFENSDHINRDRSDNRRCNLRPATRQQNMCNRSKFKNNTSGYVGVSWHKKSKKWITSIQVKGVRRHLGVFNNKEKAARVYNMAARMYHGKFSALNKV